MPRAKLHYLPGVSKEDIQQDMMLARYTGKRTSMKRLQEEKAIGYGVHPIPDAIPIWSIVPRPDYRMIELLAEFMVQQEEGIKSQLLAYLEEPDEGRLKEVVRILGGTLEHRPAPITLTQLILKSLPATLDDLYQLADKTHLSKKPKAAVRQNIRNLLKRREVAWEGDQLCRVNVSVIQTNRS